MSRERYSPARTSLREIATHLTGLDPASDPLRAVLQLRKRLPRDQARLAAEIHDLRRRAAGRLEFADIGFFTKKGLEQASRAPVAHARAAHIRTVAPMATILDATCGVGGDTLALAAAGLRVVAADRDPELALYASENLRAAGRPDRVVVADAAHPAVVAELLLLDPDRRARGRRSLDPKQWSPTLAESVELAQRFEGACLKLPPAIDASEVRAHLPPELPHRLQWVSCDRELCEVALWMGRLALGESAALEHEVLALSTQGDLAESRISARPSSVVSLTPEEVSGIRWMAEPDPAVIRAGLVGHLAETLGMRPLGPEIAWLGGPAKPDSALVRCWPVLDVGNADPRRVRALLRRHGIGPVSVLKRGHPDAPEVLERRFRGSGTVRGLLAVTRLERGHAALLLGSEGEAGGR